MRYSKGRDENGVRRSTLLLMAMFIYFVGASMGFFFCGIVELEKSSSTSTGLVPGVFSPQREIQQRSDEGAIIHKATSKLFRPEDLKLPAPIIVMGLMKAGTTSIYGYFKCGLDPRYSKLSHYDCKPGKDPQKIGMACGKRIRRNLTKMKQSAFYTMDHFTLYAEIDGQENGGGMTLPQWEFLEEVYQAFPQATWILNLRDPRKWLSSIDRWQDLRQRFIDNPFPPALPRGVGQDDTDMIHFYEEQATKVRNFASTHPSLSFVQVSIDSPDAGTVMENAFGIPRSCWGNRNMNNGNATWTLN